MTAAILSPLLMQRFNDNNGNPLAFGKVFTYSAGTSTPVATYTDNTGTAQNSNPIILNARGEAPIWTFPNVGYKYQLTDSSGNTIYTVDNVVSNQLITLYGGVDTGVANQYVLNFTASFSSYLQGTVIYWIPSNNNTGPSTINVNGLGVVSILNADGSALTANEIIANQWATIIYTGSGFQVINLNPSVINSTGTVTLTATGLAGTVTGTGTWARTGRIIVLNVPPLIGTSNSTAFGCTGIPFLTSIGAPSFFANGLFIEDNGSSTFGNGSAFISANSPSITFQKNGANSWTSTGTKGQLGFTITYFVASNFS